MNYDTITAICTAQGEGAIGIIRLSGEESVEITDKIFKTPNGRKIKEYGDRKLIYGHVYDGEKMIDEVLVAYMKGPKSYTCEDVIEINCHGGIVPLQRILKLVLKTGARMAEPGEFTKRAFLNGRLDLAQAESVMDLVSAKTTKGFDLALDQLEGNLSKKVNHIREDLLKTIAHIEVCIDYPEEDIEDMTYDEIGKSFSDVKEGIGKLLKSSETGKIMRDGLKTVIVGRPNVGKSSLLNAILRENRAIVTDVPGTTRDVIEEFISIKGVPLKIVDTAGIRETEDLVEKIGVEKSKEFFNKADLIILVLNMSEELTKEDEKLISLIKEREVIVILNKSDLEPKLSQEHLQEVVGSKKIIKTSIMNESGLEEIEDTILEMVYGGKLKSDDNSMVTNVRHIDTLEKAHKSISDALDAVKQGLAYDFIEVDMKNCYDYLGEIIGETVEDDLIDKIFSNFCLGK